ncbi:FkbM family methyltransferase [Endozoicomonas sp. 2B-B]
MNMVPLDKCLATALTVRNQAQNITILPFAISDTNGESNFIEFPEDDTGKNPFLPEGSWLEIDNEEESYEGQDIYPVKVGTLDSVVSDIKIDAIARMLFKIDVEGFEDKVLNGGLKTLVKYKPILYIDIHNHPKSDILTDDACIRILSPLGYKFSRMGHVLVAKISDF